jgi:hypothetical protein
MGDAAWDVMDALRESWCEKPCANRDGCECADVIRLSRKCVCEFAPDNATLINACSMHGEWRRKAVEAERRACAHLAIVMTKPLTDTKVGIRDARVTAGEDIARAITQRDSHVNIQHEQSVSRITGRCTPTRNQHERCTVSAGTVGGGFDTQAALQIPMWQQPNSCHEVVPRLQWSQCVPGWCNGVSAKHV